MKLPVKTVLIQKERKDKDFDLKRVKGFKIDESFVI